MNDIPEFNLTEKQQTWLTHIRKQEASDLAATGYCQQHELSVASLYNARLMLRRKGVLPPVDLDSSLAFVPVKVVDHSVVPLPSCRLVAPSGLTLEFMDPLTVSQIQAIMTMEPLQS